MNTVREIQRINDQELERGIAGTSASWHAQYAKSAWVFVGNLDHSLSEGDLICVMSQYGEIEDLHLVREEETGKSRGFAFCKYEDARSCVLAVDNFIGIELCNRTIRVDHVENYRLPKNLQEKELDERDLTGPGQAYKDAELANKFSLQTGLDLFAPVQDSDDDDSDSKDDAQRKEAKRKRKEERQQKREEKERRRQEKERRKMKKEEKRRKKRARKLEGKRDSDQGSDENGNDRRRYSSKKRRRHDDSSSASSN